MLLYSLIGLKESLDSQATEAEKLAMLDRLTLPHKTALLLLPFLVFFDDPSINGSIKPSGIPKSLIELIISLIANTMLLRPKIYIDDIIAPKTAHIFVTTVPLIFTYPLDIAIQTQPLIKRNIPIPPIKYPITLVLVGQNLSVTTPAPTSNRIIPMIVPIIFLFVYHQ